MEQAITVDNATHVEFFINQWCFHTFIERAVMDRYGQPMLKLLLSAGAEVNFTNKNGEHILFAAVRYGTLQMIRTLINAGVTTSIRNNDGKMAIEFCDFKHAHGQSIMGYLKGIMSQE